ncbi:unnamed protein product [Urochloa humidicola]
MQYRRQQPPPPRASSEHGRLLARAAVTEPGMDGDELARSRRWPVRPSADAMSHQATTVRRISTGRRGKQRWSPSPGLSTGARRGRRGPCRGLPRQALSL